MLCLENFDEEPPTQALPAVDPVQEALLVKPLPDIGEIERNAQARGYAAGRSDALRERMVLAIEQCREDRREILTRLQTIAQAEKQVVERAVERAGDIFLRALMTQFPMLFSALSLTESKRFLTHYLTPGESWRRSSLKANQRTLKEFSCLGRPDAGLEIVCQADEAMVNGDFILEGPDLHVHRDGGAFLSEIMTMLKIPGDGSEVEREETTDEP